VKRAMLGERATLAGLVDAGGTRVVAIAGSGANAATTSIRSRSRRETVLKTGGHRGRAGSLPRAPRAAAGERHSSDPRRRVYAGSTRPPFEVFGRRRCFGDSVG